MSGALHATFRRCVEIKGVYVDDDWKKLATTSSPDDGTSVAPGCASLCTFQWWRQCRAYLGSGNWAGKRLVAKNNTTVLYIVGPMVKSNLCSWAERQTWVSCSVERSTVSFPKLQIAVLLRMGKSMHFTCCLAAWSTRCGIVFWFQTLMCGSFAVGGPTLFVIFHCKLVSRSCFLVPQFCKLSCGSMHLLRHAKISLAMAWWCILAMRSHLLAWPRVARNQRRHMSPTFASSSSFRLPTTWNISISRNPNSNSWSKSCTRFL